MDIFYGRRYIDSARIFSFNVINIKLKYYLISYPKMCAEPPLAEVIPVNILNKVVFP